MPSKPLKSICRFLLIPLAMILLCGCMAPSRQSRAYPMSNRGQDLVNTARLNCFLTLKDNKGPAIRMEVSSLEVLADGVWLPVSHGPLEIDSEKIGAGQIFLGGLSVPPGHYQRLRLMVTKGSMRQVNGEYAVIAPEPFEMEVNVNSDLNLDPEDSRSLFFTWDVQNSLTPENTLRPALIVSLPLKQLQVDLVFVACPEIDTIFVIRADMNWVVDSFGLKGGPTYLAIDPTSPRQRLYVLASRERMVKVVDLSSYRVIDFFPVPLNDAPTFMTISPDGQGAFLLDERRGYLVRMDLSTGQNVARVLLGHRPRYALYLSEQDLLAVSLSLSQRILLLDPVSLVEAGTIPTGGDPQGLDVSDNQLYIAENGDNTVSIVDLAGKGGQDRLTVGFGPRRLLGIDNRIYVSNYQDGSLSVLVPGQLGVSQEIQGLGRPTEMIFDQFYSRLYVTDEEAAGLAVIDVNSNLLLGYIALGAKPFGLAVIQ